MASVYSGRLSNMLEHKLVQVHKTTIAQNIVKQLIELILNGTIAHGEKLPPEKQLMEMFGVGRSSLREAIQALNALGLIEVRVPEGTFVSNQIGGFFTKHLALAAGISFQNIAELIEARIAVETDIVELAAKKSTPEDYEKLSAVIAIMKTAVNNEQFMQADLEFHMLLAEISRNSFMLHVMNILREITREWIYKVIQLDKSKQIATEQHFVIAEAIRNNDAHAAGLAMTAHLQSVSDLLLKVHGENK